MPSPMLMNCETEKEAVWEDDVLEISRVIERRSLSGR